MELVKPTRSGEGCLHYVLHRSIEDQAVFMFYEHWTGDAAFAQHFETPYISGLAATLEGHLTGPVEVTKWAVLD